MRIYFKHFLPLLFFAIISAKEGHARFEQAIVTDVMKMTSPQFRTVKGEEVASAVQGANFLAHELPLTADVTQARNKVDTLGEVIAVGQGVGGLMARSANGAEIELMLNALDQKACYFATVVEGDATAEVQAWIKGIAASVATMATDKQELYKAHFANVATILYTSFKKYKGVVNRDVIKAELNDALDGTDWLKEFINDPSYWAYVPDVMPASTISNVQLRRRITESDGLEREEDGRAARGTGYAAYYTSLTDSKGIDGLIEATRVLQTTVIAEKATAFAEGLRTTLKTIDFTDFHAFPAKTKEAITTALITVEKYRMFETKAGSLQGVDPTPFDYKDLDHSPESEAVLLALVGAIQNRLYNPNATPELLRDLYRYQKNSRELKIARPIDRAGKDAAQIKELEEKQGIETEATRRAAQALIDKADDPSGIAGIINSTLLERIDRTNLEFSIVQKLWIDEICLRQQLMFYSFPKFDSDTLREIPQPPRFVRYFGSSGAGLQCGFFSLGFQNREQAIQQILDNQVDLEILSFTDRNVTKGSAEIKKSIEAAIQFLGKSVDEIADSLLSDRLANREKALRESIQTALEADETELKEHQKDLILMTESDIQKLLEKEKSIFKIDAKRFAQERVNNLWFYLKLYAEKNGKDFKAIEKNMDDLGDLVDEFVEEFNKLNEKIMKKEAEIDREFADRSKVMREDGKADAKVLEEFADQVTLLRNKADHQKWQAQTEFVKFIYSLKDWQEIVRESLTRKFNHGELEFDPNPDWFLKIPTYPQILAYLNGYNIQPWVPERLLARMQTERGGHDTTPLHTTEDGIYHLINFLEGSPHGKSIDLINKSGGHFEKWIYATDYSRLARAARHQQGYGIGNTRP